MKCNKIVSAFLAAGLFMTSQWASAQDLLTDAKQVIERATAPVTKWDGPTTGPTLQTGKKIIFIASDMKNGGVLGVIRFISNRWLRQHSPSVLPFSR